MIHMKCQILSILKKIKKEKESDLSAAVVIHTSRVDMFAKSGLSMPESLPEIITMCISLCKAMRKVMVELDEELVPRLTFKVQNCSSQYFNKFMYILYYIFQEKLGLDIS